MSGTEKESSHRDHIEAAEGINAIGFAVITCSGIALRPAHSILELCMFCS